jgi:hypothetical protein
MIKSDKLIIFEQYEDLVRGNIFPESIQYPKFIDEIEAIKK